MTHPPFTPPEPPSRHPAPRLSRGALTVLAIAVLAAGLLAALVAVNADPAQPEPGEVPSLVVPESPNAPSVGPDRLTPLPNPDGPLDGNPAPNVADYRVPEQMRPGTWITDGAVNPSTVNCEWQRTRPRSNGSSEVKDGVATTRPTYVTVKAGDEFATAGCKPWRRT